MVAGPTRDRDRGVMAADLVRDGAARCAISWQANGDTKLLLPAGPSEREPRNHGIDSVFHRSGALSAVATTRSPSRDRP
jgi:hypothetical protein